MHWGTFTTVAHSRKTVSDLDDARKEKGVSDQWSEQDSFVISDLGVWLEVDL